MVDIDNNVIVKCKKRDLKSFEILINTYSRTVYNILYRMLGNEEDAKDISQEVFMKIYDKIHTFNMQSKFSTWLYRITVNCGKDFLKKRKDITVDNYKAIENQASIKNDYNDKDNKIVLEEGLRLLKDDLREIIILKDIQGFSYEEISDILNVKMGTVKSRLNRARLSLRSSLIDLGNSY